MANKKTCPSCGKKVKDHATKCPECKEQLEILNWEIALDSGEFVTYSDVAVIREELLAGKLNLPARCRQFKEVLVHIDGSQKKFDKIAETEWRTVKDFAENEFLLLSLYDPCKAYKRKIAADSAIWVGIIVAIAWVANGLIAFGANLFWGVVLSIVLLITFPTVILGAFTGRFVAITYDISVYWLLSRVLLAYFIGALIGAAVGLTIGRFIGNQIGSRKPQLIAA